MSHETCEVYPMAIYTLYCLVMYIYIFFFFSLWLIAASAAACAKLLEFTVHGLKRQNPALNACCT